MERLADVKWDILGLGCTAVDDLVYVASYPPADAKTQVLRRQRQCGGLTATALVAASRLGASCAFAGALGRDELSSFVVDRLRQEGVDTHHVCWRDDAQPVHAIIIVDESRHTRNIFFDLNNVIGADPNRPPAEVIRSARVLYVDYIGMEGMVRAARIARESGIPVVADIEDNDSLLFEELLGLVDHLVVSQEFVTNLMSISDPAAAVRELGRNNREAVVVTCGSGGCWYASREDPTPRHQPAFKVDVMDTTGCGDVFHGAYAAALAKGMPMTERVRFASAAAGLKAKQPGGQQGAPTRAAVEAFLREY